jgi:IPT/TIG domain
MIPSGDTGSRCAANTKAHAFPQVGIALACVANGDTVSVAAGTSYSGIGTIADNITIAGAGARSTQINIGSAPLTVAVGADVTVSGVTLTAVNDATTAPNVTNYGILTVTRDVITGNTFNNGIQTVTTTPEGSDLVLNSSTVSDNFGPQDGGGIEALAQAAGPLQVSLVNSTVTGNTAGALGGGLFVGNGGNPTLVSLVNSTVSGNSVLTGGRGGGIAAVVATVNLSNTILAGNTAPGRSSTSQDCVAQGGLFADGPGRHNLLGDIAGCTGLAVGVNGDKTGAPGLAALANNGGPTDTLALLAGSPAIAAGNATTCAQPPVSQADQRGDSRRAGSRGSCDIGAYDTGGVPVAGAVTPAHGSTSGGTAVTVTGSGFTKVSKVLFGTVAGTKMQVVPPPS